MVYSHNVLVLNDWNYNEKSYVQLNTVLKTSWEMGMCYENMEYIPLWPIIIIRFVMIVMIIVVVITIVPKIHKKVQLTHITFKGLWKA